MEHTFDFEKFKQSVNEIDINSSVSRILDDELNFRGIDWRKFYNGDTEACVTAEKILNKYGINISTDSLKARINTLSLDDVKEATVISLTNENGVNMIDYVQNLKGDDIKKYILKTVDNLKMAERQTSPGALAMQVYSSGITAIGTTWGAATLSAYMMGGRGLAAIIQGLTIATVATVISEIIVVLLLVFIPFLILMEKKAEIMGLLINRSSSDLKIKDMYLAHGKMVSLSSVEDKHNLKNKIFCPASARFDTGNYSFEYAYAGFIYASKRDYALIGVEGAIQFQLINSANPCIKEFNLGFSVPLASGHNKCGISCNSYNNAQEYFEKEYNNFTDESSTSSNNMKLATRINSKKGGEVYMISTIYESKS